MHIRPALAALALACAPLPAFAQACFPWADALKIDHEQFGQLPAFIASTDAGAVIILTVNEKNGAWTLWVQPNADVMCVAATGEGWEPAPQTVIDGVKAKAGRGT